MNKNHTPYSNNKKLNTLSEDITNLIDSNKTITKISIVIKELIENSIDANSKNISIFIKDGGLSLIEIKDDGNGIVKENFSKLCQRFNSSKVEKYEDIYNLTTFGFRGEALSILSYISHLTILSRTENSDLGYEGTFKMGKLTNSEGNLKRLPCEKGTVIRVENIFFNNLIRKNYYDKNEETKDIINLISKYSFHFHKINFSLANGIFSNKIFTTNMIGLQDENEDKYCNHLLRIKKTLCAKLFNQEIGDNLNYFKNFEDYQMMNEDNFQTQIHNINLKTEIEFECYFTKPSANLNKSSLIIFVNDRLILNSNIKKVFDQTYSKYLIKHGNYFVYLNINCPPSQIDVNVRANKSEVLFMNEEKFLLQLKFLLENNLNEEISSKNYYVGEYSNFQNSKKRQEVLFSQSDYSDKDILYAKDKIRVDPKTVLIEKFLIKMTKNGKNEKAENFSSEMLSNDNFSKTECLYTINKEIFNPVEKNKEVTEIIKNNYFIGFDSKNYLTFVQFNTSLYIINTKLLLDEYIFYVMTKQDNCILNMTKLSKIKSNYKISDILKFIQDNFQYEESDINKIPLQSLEEIIKTRILVLETVNIKINENLQIVEIILYDFFKEILSSDSFSDPKHYQNFKKNYLCYIPMIYYSIIETLVKFDKLEKGEMNKKQQNDHLNFIMEICKIISHYNSNYYIEYLCKLGEEECNRFLRDYIMTQIKKDSGFFIRKNIREENLIEKLVDTETLYTVFERC